MYLPINLGHSPINHGHLPIKHRHTPINLGHFPTKQEREKIARLAHGEDEPDSRDARVVDDDDVRADRAERGCALSTPFQRP